MSVLNKRTARTAIILVAGLLAFTGRSSLQASDPYDAQLEKRVEALERELNVMSADKKGKNLEEVTVPTFLRAAGSQVQQLVLSGDLRFRYNYDNFERQALNAHYLGSRFYVGGSGNKQTERSRNRFRLRLNLDYKFSDNWFLGLGISTAPGDDSAHQTFTEGFDNYSIYLWTFYLGWKPTDNVTILLGKSIPPFYNNSDDLVDWGDIHPTGFTETINFDLTPQLNLKLNLGQYAFYDNNEDPGVSGVNFRRRVDTWLLYQEAVFQFKPTNAISTTDSIGFYWYPGHGAAGTGTNANSQAPVYRTDGTLQGTGQFNDDNATRELYVLLAQGDAKLQVGQVPFKVYYDFAFNFRGGARAYKVYNVAKDGFLDKSSALGGIQFGELKKRGDWYIAADYRYNGLASIDPNLNDPNFAQSSLNMQGFRIAAGYNFYSWLRGEVIYYGAWNLKKDIKTASPVTLATYNATGPNTTRVIPAGSRYIPGTYPNATATTTVSSTNPNLITRGLNPNVTGFLNENASQFLLVQMTATF